MLFSSIPFLYYFLPVVLILYFLAPDQLRNAVLLVASLLFYAWGEPKYIILMIVSILLGYLFGILIERYRGTGWSKVFLSGSVLSGLGLLAYFKYANFFIENYDQLTGQKTGLLKIALPVGISFYTFQILSYTIDVYRGEVKAQRNLILMATYVALFPQLIAGPIVRYIDVETELKSRQVTLEKVFLGIRCFIIGLSKKVLIANALGELCGIFKASAEKSVVFYWIYGIAFSLQIYFDFSGYSDMAIGLGKIFGFHFLENFNYPYVSKSITEFWRRWHISLGSWFRDYLYIPLGGNRGSFKKWLFNIALVWMLTGLWHGAAWNFILWGLLFALLLILEKVWLGQILKKLPGMVAHLYVLFFVMLSFVLFNAKDLTEAVTDIRGVLGFLAIPLVTAETFYYLRSYGVILVLAIVGATPFFKQLIRRVNTKAVGANFLALAEPIGLISFLLLVTGYLIDGSFNPFLYFRF